MLHLRTDWAGIQDLRHVLLRLNDVEIALYHAFSERGLDPAPLSQLSFAIDEIARQAGVSPRDAADRTFPTGSTILPDEPVFLLRAKDVVSPAVAHDWADRAANAGADLTLVARVHRWADEMAEYAAAKRASGDWGPAHAPDAPGLLPDPEGV